MARRKELAHKYLDCEIFGFNSKMRTSVEDMAQKARREQKLCNSRSKHASRSQDVDTAPHETIQRESIKFDIAPSGALIFDNNTENLH